MPLYISNTSKNHQEINFRIPGNNRHFTAKIAPGRQELIYKEGTRDDHVSIVEQLKPYGLRSVDEIDRSKEFVGLCYQFDKPIPAEKLLPVFSHNDAVIMKEAQERRQEAAIAMDDALSRNAQETGAKFNGLEVGIEEQEQKGVDTKINEAIEVENPARGRGRRRRP
ncbi:hypothetical protein [Paraburkholderia phenoliruptrix]|uniref:hypothetical protein n=1 Tax=Paraburkholderia phenoliruptrix TaxID=252970 RepID=UPI00285E3682|nr:hypothetical protein [Paraburkholderia phenoliruptrix]MDR6389224.1 hypothetical protein [Paraburkholderia phenoliruptrix]